MSTPDIFYVEDDTDFAFLLENAFQEVNAKLNLTVIDNGKDALDKLKQLTEAKIKPRLILLDLNLPGFSGLDLVKMIRENAYLRYTPVLFFSTSDNPKDVKASLEYGANAFITKPAGYMNLVSCLQSVYDFWFTRHTILN